METKTKTKTILAAICYLIEKQKLKQHEIKNLILTTIEEQ